MLVGPHVVEITVSRYKDAGAALRRKQDKEREAAGLPPVQRVGARGAAPQRGQQQQRGGPRGGGGGARPREQGGLQPGLGGAAGVEGLGVGAEHLAQADDLGGGDAEGVGGLRAVEGEQLGAGGGGACCWWWCWCYVGCDGAGRSVLRTSLSLPSDGRGRRYVGLPSRM